MGKRKVGTGEFTIELDGFDTVYKNLELTKDQTENIKAFLEDEAEKLIELAQEDVPYDTGALHDTHRRGNMKVDGKQSSVEVVAGGMIAKGKYVNYARKVHRRDPWLATAHAIRQRGFAQRLARAIKLAKKLY